MLAVVSSWVLLLMLALLVVVVVVIVAVLVDIAAGAAVVVEGCPDVFVFVYQHLFTYICRSIPSRLGFVTQ